MTYARNREDAKRFIAENYEGNEVEKTSLACDCGDTEGYVIYDGNGNEIDSICVCESCWGDSAFHDRIDYSE